jgi:uncharacterized protein (DUF2062 family)
MDIKDLKLTPMQGLVFVIGLILAVLVSSWLTLLAFSTLFFEVPITFGSVCSLAWLKIIAGSTLRGLK